MTDVLPLMQVVDGLTYRGTAYVPSDRDGIFPTVVLHHGFGSMRQEAGRLFVQLSRALAEHGIMAVAFDRAGHGESDGDFFDTTVSSDVATSLELLRRVREQPGVDAERIHLIGMSIGSVVASAVAAKAEFPIASLTLLSPAAVFTDELRAGTLQGRSIDVVERDGYFSFNGSRLGPAFFDDARHFDPYASAAGYEGPVRVIHGGADEIVPSEYALRYREVYGDRVDVSIREGGDHMWSDPDIRAELLSDVVAFLAPVEVA